MRLFLAMTRNEVMFHRLISHTSSSDSFRESH